VTTAAFDVALARGETAGCIESTGPVTPEERRRMGRDIVAGEANKLGLDNDDTSDA
jgi:hypothetical protein